jgi:hypothetical protein
MRVVLVSELTRLDLEVVKDGTTESVKRNYEKEYFIISLLEPDTMYKAELIKVKRCILNQGINVVECLRHEAQSFIFRDDDIVIILGDDGAFVNIAKLLNHQKVITIATTTKRCGRLMKFSVNAFEKYAVELFAGERECVHVAIARAETSLGHQIEAVNDFYVGRLDLRSSRYSVMNDSDEFVNQISSGVIISTGTGSSGWEKSSRARDGSYFERGLDDDSICVIIRELCSGEDLGVLETDESVTLRSDDNDNRVMADGVLIDSSTLQLPAGSTVTIFPNVRAVSLCV